jgi:hypothetical protein
LANVVFAYFIISFTQVLSPSQGWISLEEYIKTEMDENVFDILRRNVVTATRNYQHRVEALMNTIVRSPKNPLSVKHFATKLEFQARGAGHNHGVLWLDIERIEQKVDIRQLDIRFNLENDHHLKDAADVGESLDTFFANINFNQEEVGGAEGGTNKKKKTKAQKHISLKMLEEYLQAEKLNEDQLKILKELKSLYPLYGLKSALRKIHKGKEEVSERDFSIVAAFVDTFSTVSLHPAIVGPSVAAIAKEVNQHHHTLTCRKHKTVCRFKMPKLPSIDTIIARPPPKTMEDKDKKSIEAKHGAVTKKVREVLNNKEEMKKILDMYPKDNEKTVDEAREGRQRRIYEVLNKAGLKTENEKNQYKEALAYSSVAIAIVMARDIDELNINTYNPEITRAWDGNTDFQICLDFYAIVTYITEYYTKDDTGLVKILVNTLKESNCDDPQERRKLLSNTWIKNRQMGEAEAVYRLNHEFHFRDSDTKCVFLQACMRSERSKILKNVTDKPGYESFPKVVVENHKGGVYVVQYDIHSKYERRPQESHPILKHLSLAQMVKIYEPAWKPGKKKMTEEEIENGESDEDMEKGEDMEADDEGKSDEPKEEDGDADSVEKFKRIMAGPWPKGEGPLLPKVFKLTEVYPGEPPFQRLRTKPTVLRFHKYQATKDAESYWFSEAMKYMPYSNEDDLIEKINQATAGGEEKWNKFVDEISYVKSQVMEYLEDTEEARLMAAEMYIDNNLTGEFMDAEGEHEREENQLGEVLQQQDFDHLDPEFMVPPEEGVFEKAYRVIEVRQLEVIKPDVRRMDNNQKKVLEIGIRFARGLVKSRGGKNPPPSQAPLVMVDGAAGAGKSTTINLLREIVQLILQQPGDHPECPYIVLCAPTGTAAINIKGQTLHSTFGFTWGNDHNSLSDKTRDTRRATFKNLKFVVIDEVLSYTLNALYS